MNPIDSREQFSNQILEQRFIRSVLRNTASEIDDAQKQYMSGRGFEKNEWYSGRGFTVSENTMTYSHLSKHRFVDMKYRNSKKGKTKKKTAHPVHNRIIYGHYNNIIKELHFGFTEAVKEEMRNLQE